MKDASLALVMLFAVCPQATGLIARMWNSVAAKAEVLGESKASSQFFAAMLEGRPKNMTKAKQEAVVKSLEVDDVKKHMQGKDRAMMEKMDEWSERMNHKAKI